MKKIILLILISFSSLVGYSQLPVYEGFEGTFPPTGWLVKDNRTDSAPNWSLNTPAATFPAHTGNNAAFINRENTGAGVYSQEWLITPQQTVLANSQLRFFTRQTLLGDDNAARYQVRASTSANQADLAAYTILVAEYSETDLSTETPNQLDYEEKIINLPFTGARFFAFVKVNTQPGATASGDRWLIDDVRLIERCVDPIAPLGVPLATLTATSAVVTWSVPTGSTQSQFEVQYGLQGFDLGTGTIIPATSTTTPRQQALGNVLTEGVCYQFYVRAVCPVSNSEWIGPFNFCTPPLGSTCGGPKVVPILPYSDASNTLIYGNNITATSPGTTGCGTTGAFLGGNDVVYAYTATANGFLNIQMNPLGSTNTGVFVYNSCTNVGTTCVGGVGNANANIRIIPALQVTSGVTYYIVISSTTATTSFPYTLTIQKVTCPNPVNGIASSAGLTNAFLSWANGTGGTSTSWQVAVQTLGTGVPTGAGVTANTNTNFEVTDLTSGTAYQYWVRADCGNGQFSIWSGPYPFNTSICEVANQCNYTFSMTDSSSNGWNGATMQVRQNNIVVATIGGTFTTGGGPINVTVGLCDGIPFDLFWNNGGANPGQCRIAIRNSFNQTIYAMTTASAPLVGTSLFSQTVDCINPLCQVPTGLTVPTVTVTSNSAIINWTSSGIPTTGWELYVVPAGDPAPSLISTPTFFVPGPLSTFTILPTSGFLAADFSYDVYVRSVCSVNGPSDWSLPPVTFHTLPTCPKPTNVTIPTGTTLTNNSFVVNWTPGTGTAWQVLVVPSPSSLPLPTTGWINTAVPTLTVDSTNFPAIAASTTYDVYIRTICLGGADIGQPAGPTTVQTKICNPSAQCDYTFNVQDDFGDGWNGGILTVSQNGVVVATLTGPTNAQDTAIIPVTVKLCTGVPFDLFWTTAGGFPDEIRVSIVNPFNQTLYAITQDSGELAGTLLYHDSAADCQFPKCLKPSLLYANPLIDNATLGWTGAGNNTSWDVYVVLAPGLPAPDGSTFPTYPNVPGSSVLATGLQAGTDYVFYVRGLCAVGAPGDWVGPFAFTTLPTCPQPINLNYVTTSSDRAGLVWSEVGPATNWSIFIQPSGGTAPAADFPGCPVATLPTTATPYSSFDCNGALVAGFYEFYVRSNCSSDDLSHWSGPFNFLIPSAPLVCAKVETPGVPESGIIDFCPGEHCVDLSAVFTDSGNTTQYTVTPVAFAPPFPFTGGTQLSIGVDDIWGPVFPLPFEFCFFGANYPNVQVGSNGVLSFTTTYPPLQAGGCEWNTEPGTTVPNPNFPILNAIYGVYQDINPATATPGVTRSINYQVLGEAPCRTFVLNFLNIAQFSCGTNVGLQTSQIVLYETSNIIEVYVKDRTACTGWNEGSGVIGIQNNQGTAGYTPLGRNLGPWDAHNEAWRFTPSGPSNVEFSWLKGTVPYSNSTNINVCVTETTVMTAKAIYTGCGGQQATKTKTVTLRINDIDVAPINDVTVCDSYTLPTLPAGQNYFASPGGVDPITNPVITATQVVYVRAQTAAEPFCSDEEHFTVNIEELTAPDLADVSECLQYDLPPIAAPFNYYAQSGGGTPLTGPITASQDVYIYGTQGLCSAETLFHVAIGEVNAFEQPDILDCLTVTLPPLPAGQAYYSQTGGPNSGSLITNTTLTSSQTVYIYAQTGTCTDESSFEVTINSSIIPEFLPIPNLCVGAIAPLLPLVSENGITGTWNPPLILTLTEGTTIYEFTPNGAIPCAVPTTLSVTVGPPTVPNFLDVTLCAGDAAPVLLGTSPNGVTGSWLPATIDNTTSASYLFTPTPGLCALPQTISVTVNPIVTANFAQIAPFCSGSTVPVLATTSPNGVSGTWSPATISNTTSGCYTFTPNTGQCALGQTMCITVNPTITPTFNSIPSICAGQTAPILPLSSTNSISGTWSPATVSNTTIGTSTYTFTPTPGGCATTQTVTVTVTDIPVFMIKSACQSDNNYKVYIEPDFGDDAHYAWTYNGAAIQDLDASSFLVSEFNTGTGTYAVQVTIDGCPGSSSTIVNSIACIIQRGISPKGSGAGDNLNDFFDLQGMNVKQLEIFNRYGTKVYAKNNYSNEWYGQSDKGDELPDGTYYYVIEYTNGNKSKTGWIYINREK